MPVRMSQKIREKLLAKAPPVTDDEVFQCFANRTYGDLEDTRPSNITDTPTLWFISNTDAGRLLKIVYIDDGTTCWLKTAYEPNAEEVRIYGKYAP